MERLDLITQIVTILTRFMRSSFKPLEGRMDNLPAPRFTDKGTPGVILGRKAKVFEVRRGIDGSGLNALKRLPVPPNFRE
jgi:hypothetical protein